jgi:hypothetical protein
VRHGRTRDSPNDHLLLAAGAGDFNAATAGLETERRLTRRAAGTTFGKIQQREIIVTMRLRPVFGLLFGKQRIDFSSIFNGFLRGYRRMAAIIMMVATNLVKAYRRVQ